MALRRYKHSYDEGQGGFAALPRPSHGAALIAGAAAPIVVLLWVLPAPLVLPALSVLSILMSVVVGVYAYLAGDDRRSSAITNWDIAAAFMLVGCVAGLLGEPQNALQFVGEAIAER